jgi:pseudouridylate synthase
VETVIVSAIREASEAGVAGKDLTPYLLRRLVDSTGGAALEANVALLRNNVEIAASVASLLGRSDV